MAAAQAVENHVDEWGITWYLGWIYTSIPTWINSQEWPTATEAQTLNKCPRGTLSNHHKNHSNQHKNSYKLCNEMEILLWVWWKVNGNWKTNMITLIFPNTGIRRTKFKRAGWWKSQSGILVEKLTIWVRPLEIQKL